MAGFEYPYARIKPATRSSSCWLACRRYVRWDRLTPGGDPPPSSARRTQRVRTAASYRACRDPPAGLACLRPAPSASSPFITGLAMTRCAIPAGALSSRRCWRSHRRLQHEPTMATAYAAVAFLLRVSAGGWSRAALRRRAVFRRLPRCSPLQPSLAGRLSSILDAHPEFCRLHHSLMVCLSLCCYGGSAARRSRSRVPRAWRSRPHAIDVSTFAFWHLRLVMLARTWLRTGGSRPCATLFRHGGAHARASNDA